jgi:hypothetical protein
MDLLKNGCSSENAFSKIKEDLSDRKARTSIIRCFKRARDKHLPRIAQEMLLLLHLIIKGIPISTVDCEYFQQYHAAFGWSEPPSANRLRF